MNADEWISSPCEVSHTESGEGLDELFGLLADSMTCQVLCYLTTHSQSDLDTVADVVTGMDAMGRGSVQTTADRDRVRIRLYHETLPRLAEGGYVTFDSTTKRVTAVDIPEPIAEFVCRDQ